MTNGQSGWEGGWQKLCDGLVSQSSYFPLGAVLCSISSTVSLCGIPFPDSISALLPVWLQWTRLVKLERGCELKKRGCSLGVSNVCTDMWHWTLAKWPSGTLLRLYVKVSALMQMCSETGNRTSWPLKVILALCRCPGMKWDHLNVWERVKGGEESVWALHIKKDRRRESKGREQEGRRRRGCPVILKPGAFEKEEGKDTGRKKGGKKKRESFASHPGFITTSIWRKRDREGETGQPGPSSGAGSIWCCRLWNE